MKAAAAENGSTTPLPLPRIYVSDLSLPFKTGLCGPCGPAGGFISGYLTSPGNTQVPARIALKWRGSYSGRPPILRGQGPHHLIGFLVILSVKLFQRLLPQRMVRADRIAVFVHKLILMRVDDIPMSLLEVKC